MIAMHLLTCAPLIVMGKATTGRPYDSGCDVILQEV